MSFLIDAVITVAGAPETGDPYYTAHLIDRYTAEHPIRLDSSPEYTTLDDALKWARAAATAVMVDAGVIDDEA